LRGVDGIWTRDQGFADPCLATWPRRHRVEINRAGGGIRTHDLLLGKETFYQLNYARMSDLFRVRSAESQDRTDDTAIFSRVLYQLSYLGKLSRYSIMRANFTRCMLIVKHRLITRLSHRTLTCLLIKYMQ
jgi:hypothetical protein